jgi:endoglucanase
MAFGMLAVLFGVFSVNGCVSRPAAETAADANRRLGRGINLGNMLEAPAEGAWGISAQPEYLQLIRAAGFGFGAHCRVPGSAQRREQPPYTIDSAFFAA